MLSVASDRTARQKGAYFLVQGVFVTGWWVLVLASPAFASLYFVDPSATLARGFLVADLVCLTTGSFVSGVLSLKGHPASTALSWATAGAAVYACFMAIAVNWPIFRRPLADIGMVLTAYGSLWAASKGTK